jgi:hypothetical protein
MSTQLLDAEYKATFLMNELCRLWSELNEKKAQVLRNESVSHMSAAKMDAFKELKVRVMLLEEELKIRNQEFEEADRAWNKLIRAA